MTASQHRSLRIPHHVLFAIVTLGLACGGQGVRPLDGAAESGGDGQLSNDSGDGGDPPALPGESDGAGAFERCELVTSRLLNQLPPEPLNGVRLARFNSDGYLDALAERMLCCADTPEDKRNIHVFTGRADGTLSLLTTLELEDPPASAHLADLNGDALDDILASTPNRVVPFINDGAGVFTRQTPVDTSSLRGEGPVGQYAVGYLGARDFNADGTTDPGTTEPGPECAAASLARGLPRGGLERRRRAGHRPAEQARAKPRSVRAICADRALRPR